MTALEIITQIQIEKKSKNIVPTHALLTEIMNRAMFPEIAKEELKELEKQGKISIGDTINDKYIELR